MKGKILQFEKIEDGQYKVTADLSALFENREDLGTFRDSFNEIKDKDGEFKNICKLKLHENSLTYMSETLIPEEYDSQKKRVLIVLGNPATHSILNGMFFFSKKGDNRHQFWRKLNKAGLFKDELELRKEATMKGICKTTIREKEAELRKEKIKLGKTSDDYVIGLTTFYSFPTPTGLKEISKFCDAKGVENLFKQPVINTIREEEYERIKSYSFSKGAILVFTQESSHKFVEGASTAEEKKRLLYWPIMLKNSGGNYLRGELDKVFPKKP